MNIITKIGVIVAVGALAGCAGQGQIAEQQEARGMFQAIFSKSHFRSSKVVKPSPLKPVVAPPKKLGVADAANDVLLSAMGLVGTPYRLGGSNPEQGFDCSGLITHVFSTSLDMSLPRNSAAMSQMPVPTVPKTQLKTGDLVFFSTEGSRHINHVGIYVGKGRFVHSPRPGRDVSLANLNDSYWVRSYREAKRVITPSSISGLSKDRDGNQG
jgi:cell wall-associated NlpC family hydrolase